MLESSGPILHEPKWPRASQKPRCRLRIDRRDNRRLCRFLLEQIVEARRYLESNQQIGKIVVTV